MISRELQAKAAELFDQGISQRAIAANLGIARSSLCDYIKHLRLQRRGLVPQDIVYFKERVEYSWCEACRAKVKMPCLACQIRKLPIQPNFD